MMGRQHQGMDNLQYHELILLFDRHLWKPVGIHSNGVFILRFFNQDDCHSSAEGLDVCTGLRSP